MPTSNHNSFRVLFDKVASVLFYLKMCLYFSTGNGQPTERALRQLYQHTFVPYIGKRKAWFPAQNSSSHRVLSRGNLHGAQELAFTNCSSPSAVSVKQSVLIHYSCDAQHGLELLGVMSVFYLISFYFSCLSVVCLLSSHANC